MPLKVVHKPIAGTDNGELFFYRKVAFFAYNKNHWIDQNAMKIYNTYSLLGILLFGDLPYQVSVHFSHLTLAKSTWGVALRHLVCI